MSLRSSLFRTSRSIPLRFAPARQQIPASTRCASVRGYAEKKGPNEDNAPHVSEEAAQTADIMGETKPDIEGHGTPVQDILKRDNDAKKNAPQVIKDDLEKSAADSTTFANMLALGQMESIAAGHDLGLEDVDSDFSSGHKFPLPTLPIPSQSNIKYRYDPIVNQVTNLIMEHGKKSAAQRNMSFILNHLRTAPPPRLDPTKPLLPGAPPAYHLPLNPILYLQLAIDSVAPLLRIRSQKGAAGGGAALQIPIPLSQRQRRRQAMMWILDAVDKKKSRGSGRGQFALRVAEEIVSVVEGKSSAWDKRQTLHKTGTSARVNLTYGQRRR